MYEDYELTEEHFKIAENNGLSKQLVKNRFNTGWEIDRAITQPKGNQGYLRKMVEKAAENGIKLTIAVVHYRKKKGWSDEEIVTSHMGQRRGNKRKDYEKIALENGIGILTFRGRLNRHWSEDRASTEPVQEIYRSRYKTN